MTADLFFMIVGLVVAIGALFFFPHREIKSLFYGDDLGEPEGLEEEVYKYATIWEIFWSSHRVVLKKRYQRRSSPPVMFGKMDKVQPNSSNIEEYYQKVLVGYEYDGRPFNKYKFICDGYDLERYVIFDDTHKNRVITSTRDISNEEYSDYMDKLVLHWENKVKEAKENKKIKERNTKRWVKHLEKYREKRGL